MNYIHDVSFNNIPPVCKNMSHIMKAVSITTIIVISSMILMPITQAHASCVHDNDWPGRPCLDTPPYSESELKQIWDQYYQLKGSTWMEMKKTEMNEAIKNGILKEWYEYGKASNNFANSNVWNYYYTYGQAPDIISYYNGTITKNDLVPIITYYYISSGAIILLGGAACIACVAGFFIYKKISFQKNI